MYLKQFDKLITVLLAKSIINFSKYENLLLDETVIDFLFDIYNLTII